MTSMTPMTMTSSTRRVPRLAWVLGGGLALILLSGCPDTDFFGDGLDPGFTTCGSFPSGEDQSCPPGQHCADPEFSECANGCVDNLNCAAPTTCVKTGTASLGSCSDHAGRDATQRCLDACNKLVQCGGLDAESGNQCNNDCQSVLSDTERLDLAMCAEPWSCTDGLAPCLGIECGPSYACPGGQDCVSGRCL